MQLKSRIVRWGQYVVCKCFWHRAKSVCLLLLALRGLSKYTVFWLHSRSTNFTRQRRETDCNPTTAVKRRGTDGGPKMYLNFFEMLSFLVQTGLPVLQHPRQRQGRHVGGSTTGRCHTTGGTYTSPFSERPRARLSVRVVRASRSPPGLLGSTWPPTGYHIEHTAGPATACLRNNETANRANKNV